MTRFHGGPRRAGFTVVELLVVIAVIAILAGLILSAVQNVRNAARKTQTVNDIQQMSTAIQNFKAKYRVDYIPSQIVLCENLARYNNPIPGATPALQADSLDYLTRVWPHIASSGARFNWSGRPNTTWMRPDSFGIFRSGGWRSRVPNTPTGMTFAFASSAIRATPVFPRYSRPSGLRVPSG